VAGATAVLAVLFVYRPATTWPGLGIVVMGGAVYGVLKAVAPQRLKAREAHEVRAKGAGVP
jgi:ABC-type uncharacterized transport system permease subunit